MVCTKTTTDFLWVDDVELAARLYALQDVDFTVLEVLWSCYERDMDVLLVASTQTFEITNDIALAMPNLNY